MDGMYFEEWTAKVRLHVLAEVHGPEEAERRVKRSPLLARELPDDLQGEGLLSRRPSADGAGIHPRSDEAKARDAGLAIEQWRALSR